MRQQQIDLYLHSEIGLWSLDQVNLSNVGQVFTLDEGIARHARDMGFKVWTKNANSLDFAPSEIGFSVHYRPIFKKALIEKYRKVYNLHPGYLPWGRGLYPYFWALWEKTPAGATLHELTEGVDEGPIVEQIRVEYHSYDTGGDLFERIEEAERQLFLLYWKKMIEGESIPSYPQPAGGTSHSKKEFFELKERANWMEMDGRELVRLIRCLTFYARTGLEVLLAGRKFEVRLEALAKTQ
jgi:methionyl-tRNA formyltransferase